jgi:hypothetical protein
LVEGLVTCGFTLHLRIRDHYMILEAPWDGLSTLSFGLSQFDSGGSWLVCDVALMVENLIYSHWHAFY